MFGDALKEQSSGTMTLISSWWNGASVCMVADSAITIEKGVERYGVRQTESVYGELANASPKGAIVATGPSKIVPLSDTCVVAAAGNVAAASDFLQFFAAHQQISNLAKALTDSFDTLNSCSTFHSSPFILHLARARDGQVELLRFDSQAPADIQKSCGTSFIDGDVNDTLRAEVEQFFSFAPFSDPERSLISIMAYLQWRGQRSSSFECGIGSAFCGAWIDPTGVHWHSDLRYLIDIPVEDVAISVPEGVPYEGDAPAPRLQVTHAVREGVVSLTRFPGSPSILALFPFTWNESKVSEWHAKHDADAPTWLSALNQNFVFVHIGTNLILLIDNIRCPGRHIGTRQAADGETIQSLSESVSNVLNAPHEPGTVKWHEPTDQEINQLRFPVRHRITLELLPKRRARKRIKRSVCELGPVNVGDIDLACGNCGTTLASGLAADWDRLHAGVAVMCPQCGYGNGIGTGAVGPPRKRANSVATRLQCLKAGTSARVIVGDGDFVYNCNRCGHPVAEGVREGMFIGVSMRCSHCGFMCVFDQRGQGLLGRRHNRSC